jgi:hypothetical protein
MSVDVEYFEEDGDEWLECCECGAGYPAKRTMEI